MSQMNKYVAFYKDKEIVVSAETSYAAQMKAAEQFKIKRTYAVTVVLAERDGEPVVHIPLD
ncbi:MAG: hypothetical protein ACYC5M_12720 [Anaerolineae bacterium]